MFPILPSLPLAHAPLLSCSPSTPCTPLPPQALPRPSVRAQAPFRERTLLAGARSGRGRAHVPFCERSWRKGSSLCPGLSIILALTPSPLSSPYPSLVSCSPSLALSLFHSCSPFPSPSLASLALARLPSWASCSLSPLSSPAPPLPLVSLTLASSPGAVASSGELSPPTESPPGESSPDGWWNERRGVRGVAPERGESSVTWLPHDEKQVEKKKSKADILPALFFPTPPRNPSGGHTPKHSHNWLGPKYLLLYLILVSLFASHCGCQVSLFDLILYMYYWY